MACLPAARRRLLDDDGGGHLLVAGSTVWLEWVASPSSGFAHDIVSLHPPAASKALWLPTMNRHARAQGVAQSVPSGRRDASDGRLT
eukprot:COSAG01_NODE_9789_length_2343_cov_3.490642_1_plen_86_part_10